MNYGTIPLLQCLTDYVLVTTNVLRYFLIERHILTDMLRVLGLPYSFDEYYRACVDRMCYS